jgi:NTE family protein
MRALMVAALLAGTALVGHAPLAQTQGQVQAQRQLQTNAQRKAAGAAERPVIALVLGGGGARGAAHVGVLKVLERAGVPIDIITGTSAGAIVGGLYASGLSPRDIERVIDEMDWDALVRDGPERTRQSQQARSTARSFISREVAGVRGLEVNTPTALLQGQQFDFVLRNLTLHVADVTDFDRFRIRFRAVATDAVTGSPVVMGSGDLARAIRASMSVPAVFAPVEIDDRILVDGALSSNLPVSAARALGADVVIAVDISTPLRTREGLSSLLGMMDQLSGFLTARNTAEQRALLQVDDILIEPDVSSLAPSDLQQAAKAVQLGEQAAQTAIEKIRALAERRSVGGTPDTAQSANGDTVSNTTQVAGQSSGPAKVRPTDVNAQPSVPAVGSDIARPLPGSGTAPVIRFVRFENNSAIDESVLRARLGQLEGMPLDLQRLKLGLDRLYALEVFESVRYRLVEENGERGLLIETIARSWGVDALQFGLRLSSEARRGSEFDLGAAYTARAINALNGQWRTQLQFGQTNIVSTRIYQPLDVSEHWFVDAGLSAMRTNRLLYSDGTADAEYSIGHYGTDVALGVNFQRRGDLRVGLRRYRGSTQLVTGSIDPYPGYRFDQGQLFARTQLETLDSSSFPRRGFLARAEFIGSQPELGASASFEQLRLRMTVAGSRGAHTLIGQIFADSTLSGLAPIESQFATGGLFSLPGYPADALVGQHAGGAGLTYLYRLASGGLFPLYVGASIHAANAWREYAGVSLDGILRGESLLLGAETPLGPLYLGLGHASSGRNAIYFALGKPWF